KLIRPTGITLSPTSRYVFISAKDVVHVTDREHDKLLGEVGATDSERASPAVSADEKRFAVVGLARDPKEAGYVLRALIGELPSMRPVRAIVLPFGPLPLRPVEIALSPDGARLVACDGQTAILFDLASGWRLGRVAL